MSWQASITPQASRVVDRPGQGLGVLYSLGGCRADSGQGGRDRDADCRNLVRRVSSCDKVYSQMASQMCSDAML